MNMLIYLKKYNKFIKNKKIQYRQMILKKLKKNKKKLLIYKKKVRFQEIIILGYVKILKNLILQIYFRHKNMALYKMNKKKIYIKIIKEIQHF